VPAKNDKTVVKSGWYGFKNHIFQNLSIILYVWIMAEGMKTFFKRL